MFSEVSLSHSVHKGGRVGFPACITDHMTSIWGGEGIGFPACITGHMTGGRASAYRGGGLHSGGLGRPPQVCLGGRGVG